MPKRVVQANPGAAPAPTSLLLPDDDVVDPNFGSADTSHDPTAAGETSDAEALANSAKLGRSQHGTPSVGMPKKGKVKIILDEIDNLPPTGQMFSLNGKAYCIQPGVPVDVPVGILEVIDNAVVSRPIVDPQTLKVVGHRNAQRFPYRRVA